MGSTSSHSPPLARTSGSGSAASIASAHAAASDSTGSAGCCPRCGGSGMLRHGDQRFRTCLDCLGQGRLLAEPVRELFFRPISVSASASGAR